MLQNVDGLVVYVVNLKEIPVTPLFHANGDLELLPYVQALIQAIEKKVITEPGKYGIHILAGKHWNIFKINE